jgi:hypothetical protein
VTAPPPVAASSHLAMLGAAARPAGSEATAESRAYCRAVLERAGFDVLEIEFKYSDVAGRWATPAAGVLAAGVAFGLNAGRSNPAVAAASVAAMVAGGAFLTYLGRDGVLNFPAGRRRGVNLEARRPCGGPGGAPDGASSEPKVWLVAHLDSKWQPVSMITRVIGVIATALGLVGLLAMAAFRIGGYDGIAAMLVLLTCLGCVPLVLSVVGARNHGTLDNASGVAAVLHAAEQLPASAKVGVLITDAEELALAGARAWARGRKPAVALNCDSVDDEGRLTAMHSRPAPAAIIGAIGRAAADQGELLRVIRLIPGMLTDHVPLAESGWQTVTLSRGDVRTLGRIHTSRDTLELMRGTQIANMATILVRTATELG